MLEEKLPADGLLTCVFPQAKEKNCILELCVQGGVDASLPHHQGPLVAAGQSQKLAHVPESTMKELVLASTYVVRVDISLPFWQYDVGHIAELLHFASVQPPRYSCDMLSYLQQWRYVLDHHHTIPNPDPKHNPFDKQASPVWQQELTPLLHGCQVTLGSTLSIKVPAGV